MRSEKKFKEEYELRTRSRATAIAIILLVFSMMNVPGLIGSQKGFMGLAQGLPSSLYPVNITLSTGEKVLIATHTSDLADGNWIELSGGTSIKLPSLTLAYAGLDSATYVRDGVTVTIESSFAEGEATYPLTTHHVYSTEQSITATFWGSSALASENVDFKLIRISSIAEARDILTDAFQGDLTTLHGKLDGALITTSVTLDIVTGDATVNIDPQSVGNYLLVVVKEITGPPYELYIYSATIIEVVAQTLYVTYPSTVEKGDPLNVNTGLTNLAYVHGAIMIKETAYSAEVKLVTEGTVLSTELYLNEVPMVGGAFVSETKFLSYDDAVFLLNQLKTAFGSNQFAYDISLFTGDMSLSTSSLTTGKYVLLVGVYNVFDSRIVGVYQKMVTVKTPYEPSPKRPNKPPVADAGPDQKAWVNRTVRFDGSKSTDPDGYIVDWGWAWSFGDGAEASGVNVSHMYSEPGNYTVTLTVKDNRHGEDSDTCTVTISEPPATVIDELGELVPGGKTGYVVDATDETNTTVTLNTTDPVTVTILKYEGNPYPEDPIPAMALPNYIDVEVSDPDAIIWPIYVEMSYTDEEVEGIEESSLGIYYWKDGAWQRCSHTGVDTERNVVWAYMTREEASGSPILMGGMPAITPPPLPPYLDNLNVTPAVIELGDNVTISFDIRNMDSQSIEYAVDIYIENVYVTRIWVELEAYEFKTVSYITTPDMVRDFNVTIIEMTGSFTVKAPPTPAEFVLSNFIFTYQIQEGDPFELNIDVLNVGETAGETTITIKIDGKVAHILESYLEPGGEASETWTTFYVYDVGTHTVQLDGFEGTFDVTAKPVPPVPFWKTPEFVILIIFIVIVIAAAAYIYFKKIDLSGWW